MAPFDHNDNWMGKYACEGSWWDCAWIPSDGCSAISSNVIQNIGMACQFWGRCIPRLVPRNGKK